MRTTAPALRRRNYLLRKSHREWLARRDDEGGASGEDSDDEDDGVNNLFVGRPVTSSGGLSVLPGGNARFPVVSGGTGRVAESAVVPISTIAADEQELGSDGELTSASDSDGFESGNEEDSGSDSDSDEEKEEEETVTPPPATQPPAATPPALPGGGSPGVIQIPPPGATTSTGAPPLPPPTTTTTRPSPPVLAPVQTQTPLVTTSSRASASTTVPALPVMTGTNTGFQTMTPPGRTTSPGTIADVPTQPAGTPVGQSPLPTMDLPAADVTPPPTTAQEENLASPDNSLGAVVDNQQGMNPGAGAGIVIGVLALIGLMVFGAFMWKKWRDNGKRLSALPLFFNRTEKGDGPDMAYWGATMERDTAPILAPPAMAVDKKTNSEMMDTLMQATFKAEGGYNRDSEATGTFGQKGGNVAFGEKGGPGFMNETTYTALAGPPTPAPNGPVGNWLSGIKTPHQSGAPPIRDNWPVSEYASGPPPAQPTPKLSQQVSPWQQQDVTVGKPPMPDFLPPQPAFQRDPRYTTTTTTTSTESSDMRWG